MTNKETVEKLREFCKLKAFCELYPDACRKEECEIYMSIKALEDKDTNVPSNDTISRTDAIDAVAYAEDGKDAQRILEGLVSTIPEQSAQIQDILQFLDERLHPIISPEHWNVYSELHDMISMLPSAQPDVPDTNVGDTISRQAAIDAINKMKIYRPLDSDRYVISDCLDKIVNLPSAQPEIIRCKYCTHSKHWYKDKRRCFLWHEEGIDVFEDGYCNYAKRRMRGEQYD